jgi:hypothetical protein
MMLQPRVSARRPLTFCRFFPVPGVPRRRQLRGGLVPSAIGVGIVLLAISCAKPSPPRPVPLPASAPPPTKSVPVEAAPVFYSLMVESRDLGAEILLNDILVESVDPADRATLSSAVNPWIVPGENRLSIRSARERARAGVQHMLRVRVGRRGIDSSHEDVRADFNLITPDPGATFAELRTFQADPPPPATLWTSARPLNLDDATRAAAGAVVRDLERAFERRDVKAAAALLEWKTVDIARAGFRDPELARANQRETLENLFQDAGYVVDRLNPETLQMELRAGGRLLSVARPSGPAVQLRLSQGGRFALPILIANVDGILRIAR